jgi:carbamoyltransferase
MKVLALLHGHNSSATLLVNGQVIGSASEERYDRKKNSTAFPRNAIADLLSIAKLSSSDLDMVVSASKCVPFVDPKEVEIYEDERRNHRKLFRSRLFGAIHAIHYHAPITRPVIRWAYNKFNEKWNSDSVSDKLREHIGQFVQVPKEKIHFADHHTCHAYAAFYGFVPLKERSLPHLVLTLDGEGDGLCATVSKVVDGRWTRLAETVAGNSIASFYGAVTKHLGMTVNEHEYKVMGLAPYCSNSSRDRTLAKFKGLLWVNDDLTFGSLGGGNFIVKWLQDNVRHDRFDAVAAAAQKYVEDLAQEWVTKAINKTGIKRIVLSGGFFMNIKVNKTIMELPEVEKIYVCPSAGDESVPIGAAYYGLQLHHPNPVVAIPCPDLYLGTPFSDEQIEQAIKSKLKSPPYVVTRHENVEAEVARLLASNQIVARFNGRSEFGARALGNRSILANPSSPTSVRSINEGIKSRDFWMPFACSVLDRRAADYLINPKGTNFAFMAISCETTALARTHLIAAIHPYDFTARPQIVTQESNPSYYKIISEFESLTGIGGLLNTSMNIHGEPLVNSPEDAISTFERSGLRNLAIGSFLIQKAGD